MMMSKMPVGRTASKVARVVLGNSEAKRGLATRSKNVVVSTRSGLGVQGANRLAVAQLPFRNAAAAPMGPLRRFEFCEFLRMRAYEERVPSVPPLLTCKATHPADYRLCLMVSYVLRFSRVAVAQQSRDSRLQHEIHTYTCFFFLHFSSSRVNTPQRAVAHAAVHARACNCCTVHAADSLQIFSPP